MILKIENLYKTYAKNKVALDNVSCNINEGELTGIMGPNGSGKTTLINCILNRISFEEGHIYWGENIKRDVFLIPDENILPELLTGEEYIKFLVNLYDRESTKNLDELLEVLEMKADIHSPLITYSFGMKKKIQLVAAFLVFPRLLILDEPFRGLDVNSIIVLKELFKSYVGNGGSVLFSSHDILSTEQLCDSVILIYEGQLKAFGNTHDLIERYGTGNLENLFVLLSGKELRSAKEIFSDK